MKTRLDRQVVLKLGTDVRLTVDYYNARVAVWEPLVEEGCLRLGLEVLSGDGVEGRVKQRAIAISASEEGTEQQQSKPKKRTSILQEPNVLHDRGG